MSAEDLVPESTCNTKAIFVIHKVMLKMVFLELPPVCRKGLVVQEVMCQVIANVSEDAPAEDSSCYGPIPVEHSVCELPERGC